MRTNATNTVTSTTIVTTIYTELLRVGAGSDIVVTVVVVSSR